MLKPANYNDGDIIALDRAYIDYSKFEELTCVLKRFKSIYTRTKDT